jgi:hypothetical protein
MKGRLISGVLPCSVVPDLWTWVPCRSPQVARRSLVALSSLCFLIQPSLLSLRIILTRPSRRCGAGLRYSSGQRTGPQWRRETATAAKFASPASSRVVFTEPPCCRRRELPRSRALAEHRPLPRRVQSGPSCLAGGISRCWPTTTVERNRRQKALGPVPVVSIYLYGC